MKLLKTLKNVLTFTLILCITLTAALTVSAADTLSRSELAVMVAKEFDLEIMPFEGMFQDIPEANDNAKLIEAVCRAEFMNGENGLFKPDDIVDRISLASIGAKIYKKRIHKTQIPSYGGYYDDYVLLDDDMAEALDVTAMMNIMDGISYTYFGCFEPADAEAAQTVLSRLNHLIWRKKKLDLTERIGMAASGNVPYAQKISLVHEARQLEQVEAGGIFKYDTSVLGFDFDDIVDFFEIKADDTLNFNGNAIAVRFDEDSILAEQITDVSVADVFVDYELSDGRILFGSDCFPVSGAYSVCIKCSELPDICFEQIIYDKELTIGAQ